MAGKIATVVEVVTGVLAANATVNALVGGRVFGAHPELPDLETVDYPLLIVDVQGGELEYAGVVQKVDLDLYAYHRAGLGAALDLYDDSAVVLQAQSLSQSSPATVVACRELSRPVAGYNEQARAWFARGSWRATTTG